MLGERVKVRMLVDLGGHKAGDEIVITNRVLDAGKTALEGETLLESYLAAGYVERVL